MNLGIRLSGLSAVMLKPALSEISEIMHMHRRMTLERMMLDSFVLTDGFELPCFRLWAEWMCTSVRLCVGGTYTVWACMHLQHRCAGPLVYAWPSHSWSSTPMPFGAVWWEDEKKTRDEMDDRRPFHQSPSRALDSDYLSWPRQPSWRPLNPFLCLRPFMFHRTHRHRTPSLLHLSIHPLLSSPSASPVPGYWPNLHLPVLQTPACDTRGQILDHTHIHTSAVALIYLHFFFQ